MRLPFRATCESGVPDSLEVTDTGCQGSVVLIAETHDADGTAVKFSVILTARQVRKLRKALRTASENATER